MVFVAVHIGAGYHLISKRHQYFQICSKACEVAMKLLREDVSSAKAVVEAIKCLEDDVLTNAGWGSNMNIGGYVECDASLMDGSDLLFGSVGALQNIKNPIEVAELVLMKQRETMPLGLIAPNFLVGDGAKKLAISNGCEELNLVSDKSRTVFNKYKRQLDEFELQIETKHQRFDTVGAVCVDSQGIVSSGVSSGGLILKKEGRIGQASIVGAGCWAEDNVSISTSGVGEYIVRTSLAKECSKTLLKDKMSMNSIDLLTKTFNNAFFESPLMKNIPKEDHLAGILALIHHSSSKINELLWAHSTPTMCIGYMNQTSSSAKSFISEMPPSSKPGTTINAQSRAFKYK